MKCTHSPARLSAGHMRPAAYLALCTKGQRKQPQSAQRLQRLLLLQPHQAAHCLTSNLLQCSKYFYFGAAQGVRSPFA